MTMVERVARALWDAQSTRPDMWDSLHPTKQDGMKERARAAIEAMREPTEEMCAAANGLFYHRDKWQAMIDAAL